MNKWDQWRKDYNTMPHVEQIKFALGFKSNGTVNAVSRCELMEKHLYKYFSESCEFRIRIIEMGGWRGTLASHIIKEGYYIKSWINYEIALDAILDPLCYDPEYIVLIPSKPLWQFTPEQLECDYFVASHSFEHISTNEVSQLISKLSKTKVKKLFLDVPTDETGKKWEGYNGSHKLEITQEQLIILIETYDFKLEVKDGTYLQFTRRGI